MDFENSETLTETAYKLKGYAYAIESLSLNLENGIPDDKAVYQSAFTCIANGIEDAASKIEGCLSRG